MSADTKSTVPRTVPLPSGRTATVRPLKGRDLLAAARMAGGSQDNMRLAFGLIAVGAEIDGKPLVIEDVEELDMGDVTTLMAAVAGNAAPSLNSISSSFGSTAGSPTPS